MLGITVFVVNSLCAAPMFNAWYRAHVLVTYTETDECDVRFVDYGGYARMPLSALRQIRYIKLISFPFSKSELGDAELVVLHEF